MFTTPKRLAPAALLAALFLLAPSMASAEGEDHDIAAQGKADAQRQVEVASFAGRVSNRAANPRLLSPPKSALASGSDLIDYEKLLTEVFEDANRRRDALQAAESSERRRLDNEKKAYVEASKAARSAKRAAEQDMKRWQKSEKERIKAIKEKSPREVADRQFKGEERSRRDAVNRAERNAQTQAKTTWQLAQKAYKAFQAELKKTRFEAKTMPRYAKEMKPQLLTALKKLNDDLKSVSSDAATAAAGGISIAVVASLRPDIVRGYLRYVIGERVRPTVEAGVDHALDRLFTILDKVASLAMKAVVAAIGSIPFVGGALAAVAAEVGEVVYQVIKNMVTNSVRSVGERVSDRLIDGMSERLLTVVSVKDAKAEAVIAAVLRAVDESNRKLDTASSTYQRSAAAAKAEGYNLAADTSAAAHKLSLEAEAVHKTIANGEIEAGGAGH